ncbi:hypothetical protein ACIBO6_35585 [Streptomyces luteogriseus]|uniref:hypothetical protein n=1 Tax=Streptomyces luteogriseus TaxID=68233 RepID=UPI0037B48D9E
MTRPCLVPRMWLVTIPTSHTDGSVGSHHFVVAADTADDALQRGCTAAESAQALRHRRNAIPDTSAASAEVIGTF